MGQGPSLREYGRRSSSGRWLGQRRCLRKGCPRLFIPRWWNERYCGADCRRFVQRWQARKRQRALRERSEAAREKHRLDEARRRETGGGSRSPGRGPRSPRADAPRGHADEQRGHADPTRGDPFCDRPGCYAPPAKWNPNTRCFCTAACRDALRRVEERERKWLLRGAMAGQEWCASELERRETERDRRREDRWRSFLRRRRLRAPPS